jgi:hypothetical protein
MIVENKSGFEEPRVDTLAFRGAGLNPILDPARQAGYLFLRRSGRHTAALPSFGPLHLVAHDSMYASSEALSINRIPRKAPDERRLELRIFPSARIR